MLPFSLLSKLNWLTISSVFAPSKTTVRTFEPGCPVCTALHHVGERTDSCASIRCGFPSGYAIAESMLGKSAPGDGAELIPAEQGRQGQRQARPECLSPPHKNRLRFVELLVSFRLPQFELSQSSNTAFRVCFPGATQIALGGAGIDCILRKDDGTTSRGSIFVFTAPELESLHPASSQLSSPSGEPDG